MSARANSPDLATEVERQGAAVAAHSFGPTSEDGFLDQALRTN